MALWIFGDSYSIESTVDDDTFWDYDENWIDYLAKGLSQKEANVVSQYGVSNDFIFNSFVSYTSQIKSGDYVVIQLTGKSRKWFLDDKPELSNHFHISEFSKEVKNALESYHKYLHSDNLDNIQYTAYVYAIMFIIHSRPDVKFLILPGFDDVPGVNGNLTTHVCNYELNDTSKWFESHKGRDPRLNHMSLDNHKILADKLLDYFINNTPLDLTTGFIGNLYK